MRALKNNAIANEIHVVRDGVEALDYLLGSAPQGGAELKPLPAVVLLDLKLPRLDGLDVLRAVRANLRTRMLPVVILTSSKEQQDVLQGYALGANAYVRKPMDFAEFSGAAKTLGLFWLLLNEPAPLGE